MKLAKNKPPATSGTREAELPPGTAASKYARNVEIKRMTLE